MYQLPGTPPPPRPRTLFQSFPGSPRLAGERVSDRAEARVAAGHLAHPVLRPTGWGHEFNGADQHVPCLQCSSDVERQEAALNANSVTSFLGDTSPFHFMLSCF